MHNYSRKLYIINKKNIYVRRTDNILNCEKSKETLIKEEIPI